jgi:hypothetical protein
VLPQRHILTAGAAITGAVRRGYCAAKEVVMRGVSRSYLAVIVVGGLVGGGALAGVAGCARSEAEPAARRRAEPPAQLGAELGVAADSWFFRGTPNNWGTTAMTASGATFTTCQVFSGVADPRFKVDHFGDWSDNFPAQDYRVANGTYQITFTPSPRQLSVQAVASCSSTDTWYFRGTPNGWSTTAMTPVTGT